MFSEGARGPARVLVAMSNQDDMEDTRSRQEKSAKKAGIQEADVQQGKIRRGGLQVGVSKALQGRKAAGVVCAA